MQTKTIIHTLVGLTAAIYITGLLCPATSAQQSAVLEATPAERTQEQSVAPAEATGEASEDNVAKTSSHEAKSQKIEFMRVSENDGKPAALQTAVAKYRRVGEESGAEVVLIGAVHIAEATYYSELNQLFRGYDALLYEMVMDPEEGVPQGEERGVSPVSTIQVGMKEALGLTFQLDEIDYKANNFVHADMTPVEFFESMEKRKEGVFQMLLRSMGAGLAQQSSGKSNDIEVMAAMLSGDSIALRRAFASQMEMADGQMAALTGKDGKSVLITERNAKAFKVLQEQLDAGKKNIGVFYGAGHLKDMHKRLLEDFGMELVDIQWKDAWNLQ